MCSAREDIRQFARIYKTFPGFYERLDESRNEDCEDDENSSSEDAETHVTSP